MGLILKLIVKLPNTRLLHFFQTYTSNEYPLGRGLNSVSSVLLAHSITEELQPEDDADDIIDKDDDDELLVALLIIKLFLIFRHSIPLIPKVQLPVPCCHGTTAFWPTSCSCSSFSSSPPSVFSNLNMKTACPLFESSNNQL